MSTYKFHKLQTAFVFLEAYPREVVGIFDRRFYKS